MFYYIANQDFQNFKKGDFVNKTSEFIPNEYTSAKLVDVIEADDFMFPKVVHQQGVPEKYSLISVPEYWSKDNCDDELVDPQDESYTHHEAIESIVIDIKPLVIDTSWTHVPFKAEILEVLGKPEVLAVEAKPEVLAVEARAEVLAVEARAEVLAQAEYWSKENCENELTDPQDETYFYHEAVVYQPAVEVVAYQPAIEAVEYQAAVEAVEHQDAVDYVRGELAIPEHWIKDGQEARYSQPMKLDPDYMIIPEIKDCDIVINDSIAQLAFDAQKAESDRTARGELKIKCCNEVMACIIGYNTDNHLNEQQLQQMMTIFTVAHGFLRNYFPELAKKAIESITPDGVIVTNEMKTSVLFIFSKYNM